MLLEVIGVVKKMEKYAIITMKKKGMSFRKIALELGIDRKTVAKIWRVYESAQEELVILSGAKRVDEKLVDQAIAEIKYSSVNRSNRKLTFEIIQRINELLGQETEKDELLGLRHKQRLTNRQIHEILLDECFDIGLTTVTNYVRDVKKTRESFIRQDYEYGERVEYDFGEVKLMIDGKQAIYYLAVLACPASAHRVAYLYKNQKKDVFLDSHVRFFETMRGSWKEVVYDNMRNVVSKFVTSHDRVINEDLINLSLYYGFEVNLTNIRSGHEKGTVENAVKVVRNRVFATRYKFESYEEACEHLERELIKLNKDSTIDDEKFCLQPYRPKYELATVQTQHVNKYGCIRVANNFYSIPDYLHSHSVVVKEYHDSISVYANNTLVCEHKKIDGYGLYQLSIDHYIDTLSCKPGALKHSLVLKQHPELLAIYRQHYNTRPKEFITILQQNRKLDHLELISILKYGDNNLSKRNAKRSDSIQDQSRKQLQQINQFMN